MATTDGRYDIFISYRRTGGAQYARILQLMLMQRGYRVFLDYDELTDGVFGEHIRAAISEAPVFMLVLSKGAMERCLNPDDWVRQEVMLAIEQGKHLIPVNPDNSFDGFPDDTPGRQLPPEMREHISAHQFSEIGFGQTLGVTIDLMVRNRLVPTLGARQAAGRVDTDYRTAQETLRRQDAHRRFMRRLAVAGVAAVIVMVLATCGWFWLSQRDRARQQAERVALADLRSTLQERYSRFGLQLSPGLTTQQLCTVDTLLQNMVPVGPDGTLWLSQFEFTVGLWHGILGEPCDEAQRSMPVTGKSFGEVCLFLATLADMTNLNVSLPSADEWLYAACGGENHETTRYVGDDDVDNVAWYLGNADGHPHPSDGQQGKLPNMLDLYDMSGNVGELCNTPFDSESGLYTVCGGSYASTADEVTTTARRPLATDAHDATVGFRVALRLLREE